MEYTIKETLKQSYNNNALIREKNETQSWKVNLREQFLKLLKEDVKKTLLDIGAGAGKDSEYFKNNGMEVTAVDLSDEMVRLCREKGIDSYEQDFYSLHMLDRSFDAVWAMNCLLHVEKKELALVLNEIKGVLKPGGLFFYGVYGGVDSEGIWENDKYIPHRFFAFYTDEKLKEILANHFEIVSFKRVDTGGEYYFQSFILKKSI